MLQGFVAYDSCRERSCAVPLVCICGRGHPLRFATRAGHLPYEGCMVDFFAPIRRGVAYDSCRERSCAVPLGCVCARGRPLRFATRAGHLPCERCMFANKVFKKDRSFPCRAECAYFAHSADNAFFVGRSQCVGQVELRNLTYDWYNYSQWKTTLPPQSQLN